MIDQIFIELAIQSPIAAVAMYTVWRMSLVMIKLSDGLVAIATAQNQTVSDVVHHELEDNKPVIPLEPIQFENLVQTNP